MTITVFFLSVFLAMINTSIAAGKEFPNQDISIHFDLPHHRLHGKSEITIPVGMEGNLSLRGLHIGSITINGAAPGDALTEDVLHVVSQPLVQTIRVEYSRDLARSSSGEIDFANEKGISLSRSWHPVFSFETIYRLVATIPSSFEAVSEAMALRELEEKRSFGQKTIAFDFPYRLPSLVFLAGPFKVTETVLDSGITLFTYFPDAMGTEVEAIRDKTVASLGKYEKLLGPYPYNRLNLVVAAGYKTFTSPTVLMIGEIGNQGHHAAIDVALSHQILHGWFGSSVFVDPAEGNWAEGLTTYLADHDMPLESSNGAEYRKKRIIGSFSTSQGENSAALRQSRGRNEYPYVWDTSRTSLDADRGSMFFHMLKTYVGEERFFAALRDFHEKMLFKHARWKDLLASFEEKADSRLQWFFDQWLDRVDVPDLGISFLRYHEDKGEPALSFVLTQHNKTPYDVIVPVAIRTTGGTVDRIVHLAEARREVSITLPGLPTTITIDEHYDLLRQLAPRELPPRWFRIENAPRKLIVVAPDQEESFKPFIEMVHEKGGEIIADKDASNDRISEKSVLFLGVGTNTVKTLFAGVDHPSRGFVLDLRRHPLNPRAVAGLVSAESKEETEKAIALLHSNGDSNYLHIIDGQVRNTMKGIVENGISHDISAPSLGLAVETPAPLDRIMDTISDSKVVYVGESHTNYHDHLLQLYVIRSLHARHPDMAIGMEMFNRSSQESLDKFIGGEIDERTFIRESRYFQNWGYDYRHYRDIILFAQRSRIPIVALNVEKSMTSKVFKNGGIDQLSEEERKTLPEERDLDMPGYQDRLSAIFQLHGTHGGMLGKFKDFFQAQSLWDETMAETIVRYLSKHPYHKMVVIAGHGHTRKDSGIPPRVARRMFVKQTVVGNFMEESFDRTAIDYVFFTPPTQLTETPLLGVLMEKTPEGIKITGFTPQSKAEAGGIKKDDILIALDDTSVQSIEDVRAIMVFKEKGDTVAMKVRQHDVFSSKEVVVLITL